MKYIFLVLLFIIYLIHLYFKNKNLIIKDTDNDLHTEDIEELEEIDLSKFNNLVYLDIKHLDKEKTLEILDLIIELISFVGKSLFTLHTNEKLFFEKGSIASGPSFKKYWAVFKFFKLCLT